MAEIINLRRVRKQIARAESAKIADANRAKFGQGKAERQLNKAQGELAARKLESHKRETDE